MSGINKISEPNKSSQVTNSATVAPSIKRSGGVQTPPSQTVERSTITAEKMFVSLVSSRPPGIVNRSEQGITSGLSILSNVVSMNRGIIDMGAIALNTNTPSSLNVAPKLFNVLQAANSVRNGDIVGVASNIAQLHPVTSVISNMGQAGMNAQNGNYFSAVSNGVQGVGGFMALRGGSPAVKAMGVGMVMFGTGMSLGKDLFEINK